MPIGWFFAEYEHVQRADGKLGRYCAMADYDDLILASPGGRWSESECLGDQAIVKVRATAAVLQTILADARRDPVLHPSSRFDRIPRDRLDDPTAGLTAAERAWVQAKMTKLGYTPAELTERFPLGWDGPYVVEDVLRFALTRRLKPRVVAGRVVLDGPPQETRPLEHADRDVP